MARQHADRKKKIQFVHPELQADEVFLGNISIDKAPNIHNPKIMESVSVTVAMRVNLKQFPCQGKRVGQKSFDAHGKPMHNFRPVFAKKKSYDSYNKREAHLRKSSKKNEFTLA